MKKTYIASQNSIPPSLTPQEIAQSIISKNSPYCLIDIRNTSVERKFKTIKSAQSIQLTELEASLDSFDKTKIFIICDWVAGSLSTRKAILILLNAGLKAYELPGGVDIWQNMNLPMEIYYT